MHSKDTLKPIDEFIIDTDPAKALAKGLQFQQEITDLDSHNQFDDLAGDVQIRTKLLKNKIKLILKRHPQLRRQGLGLKEMPR